MVSQTRARRERFTRALFNLGVMKFGKVSFRDDGWGLFCREFPRLILTGELRWKERFKVAGNYLIRKLYELIRNVLTKSKNWNSFLARKCFCTFSLDFYNYSNVTAQQKVNEDLAQVRPLNGSPKSPPRRCLVAVCEDVAFRAMVVVSQVDLDLLANVMVRIEPTRDAAGNNTHFARLSSFSWWLAFITKDVPKKS